MTDEPGKTGWGWLSTRSARSLGHEEEATVLPPLPSPLPGRNEDGGDSDEGEVLDDHLFARPESPNAYHSPVLKPIDGDVWSEAEVSREGDEDEEAGEETSMLRRASPPPASRGRTRDDDLESQLRKDRHVFGGAGRAREARGDLGVGEVAWEVAAACLPAAPLLMPHALMLTGLQLGLPVLFLIAALCWLSHCILAVEGRYVGGFSLAKIADAVFPRRWYGRWIGEGVVDVWSVIVSGGRAIVVIGVSTQLMVDLALAVFPRFSPYYSVPIVVVVLAVLSVRIIRATMTDAEQVQLLPSLLMPSKPLFAPAAYPVLARLPSWSIALYPIALLIVGIRIRKIDWASASPPLHFPGDGLPLRVLDISQEAMGNSSWGGVAIMLFSLSAHQTSWDQQSALRETASALHSTDDKSEDEIKSARRYGWEGASFLGMAAAALVSMGWGLVGYLGIPRGGEKANIFSSLPIADGWIATARVLVLITLLSTLSFSLHPARAALLRLFELPFAARGARSETARLRSRRKDRRSSLGGDDAESANSFEELDRRKQNRRRAWLERGIALLAWTIVALAAGGLISGTEAETGEGIASAAEVLGAVGASVSGFLLPALFFVVLFHLRRPRSIVFSRPDAPGVEHDTLLLRKERQLQKRLSGRRLWMEVAVFGLLLPFGLVVFVRSTLAIVQA